MTNLYTLEALIAGLISEWLLPLSLGRGSSTEETGYQRLWTTSGACLTANYQHVLRQNGWTLWEQAGKKCRLTALECIRKCLLVKLIINLATVSVSNYSVWVTLFPISTPLCTLACCRPHGAVNLYIDLSVCFPLLTPHSSIRWSVTSPPLSINPHSAICPKVSDAKCTTASLNPHFPPKWNLRTHKPKNLAWICTFPLRPINQASWELPCSRLVFSFPLNWLRNRNLK